MKPNLLFIAVLVCMALTGPAIAQNMSISRLGTGSLETVQIYNLSSGDPILEGTYNTSSNGISLPSGDFNLIIKPAATNPLADPGQWMADMFSYIQTNINAIIIACFLIGLIFIGFRSR